MAKTTTVASYLNNLPITDVAMCLINNDGLDDFLNQIDEHLSSVSVMRLCFTSSNCLQFEEEALCKPS
jgi:hypothetical protein